MPTIWGDKMSKLSFDNEAFTIDGKDKYLLSGEFHYFRVPSSDWKRRMELFKQAGGTTLATYVPWVVHEPEEGKILFGDRPERDIAAYLRTAQEVGLQVILRPGPYQYSELVHAGLPDWLVKKPGIGAMTIDGDTKPFGGESVVSYLHPVFLEYARKYYKAFAEAVRPFMSENGGPVTMLQLDNEMTGTQLWSGGMDYNPVTMGFHTENGRWPTWLKNKYGTIEKLNAVWGTDFKAIAAAMPIKYENSDNKGEVIRARDYFDFYLDTIAEYALTLYGWLREDGLNELICTNAANPHDNPYIQVTAAKMGKDFLLGSDHYYALSPSWPQNNPTPQYALNTLLSLDELRAMGMPPTVFELPGGSCGDVPPMLKEDMLACSMANLALGMKGSNYYIYTGGPNFEQTGGTCDVYDFHAFVSADGKINDTFEALKAFGEFTSSRSYLQRAKRAASVQIGFDWAEMRQRTSEYSGLDFSIKSAKAARLMGVMYALFTSEYSGEFVCLDKLPDVSRPLILVAPSTLSEKTQKTVCEFVARGGKLLVLPVLSELDENYEPCSVIKDTLFKELKTYEPSLMSGKVTTASGLNVYSMNLKTAVCDANGWNVLAKDTAGENVCVINKENTVCFCGCVCEMLTLFSQSDFLCEILGYLGAKKCVASSNRNIITALWETQDGKRDLFVMNLFSGKNATDIRVNWGKPVDLGHIELDAMQVKHFDI